MIEHIKRLSSQLISKFNGCLSCCERDEWLRRRGGGAENERQIKNWRRSRCSTPSIAVDYSEIFLEHETTLWFQFSATRICHSFAALAARRASPTCKSLIQMYPLLLLPLTESLTDTATCCQGLAMQEIGYSVRSSICANLHDQAHAHSQTGRRRCKDNAGCF
jgi:hypothetical protein